MSPEVNWIPAFIQGGAFIVVAFVVYHMMTKNLPQVTAHFAQAVTQQQASGEKIIQQFLGSLAQSQELYRVELKEIREHNDGNIQRLIEAIEKQNRLISLLVTAVQQHPLTPEQKLLIGEA